VHKLPHTYDLPHRRAPYPNACAIHLHALAFQIYRVSGTVDQYESKHRVKNKGNTNGRTSSAVTKSSSPRITSVSEVRVSARTDWSVASLGYRKQWDAHTDRRIVHTSASLAIQLFVRGGAIFSQTLSRTRLTAVWHGRAAARHFLASSKGSAPG